MTERSKPPEGLDVTVGSRLLDRAREIAFPRAAGSRGDPRARRIIMGWFRETGLDVSEEPFSYDIRIAFRAIRIMLVCSGLLLAAAGVVALWSPAFGLFFLAAGFLSNAALLAWAPGIERLYASDGPKRTANVVARRPARERELTLVVLAHYDSKSQNLTLPWRNGLTLLAILGGLGLAALLAGTLMGSVSEVPVWFPVMLGGVAGAALLSLSTLKSGNESPGGTDNAGSVAILAELARDLPRRIGTSVELIFLSPSAEEDHMVGAMRWLDAHREELRSTPVCALNIDGAGSPGRAVIMEWYGVGKRFAPRIAKAARDSASRLGIPVRRIWLPPAMGVDAIPFRQRGIECLTFCSGKLGKATFAVHSRRDVADNLDVEALARMYRLVRETARKVADSAQ